MTWGILPAAGVGSRLQPLGFSKELLPVGSRAGDAGERPRAVSEHVLERMLIGGADKLCITLGRDKSDILAYYGARFGDAHVAYVVQEEPSGLCGALFEALPLIDPDETVLIGLPDTVWFPRHGYRVLPDDRLGFLLFEVDRPERFDAVSVDDAGEVTGVEVKVPRPRSRWVWGAIKTPGRVFMELAELWSEPARGDEYLGTLIDAYLDRGGTAIGVARGEEYIDCGTVEGYREASALLQRRVRDGDGAERVRIGP